MSVGVAGALYYDQLSSANLHLGKKYPITSPAKTPRAENSKSVGRQFEAF